MLALAPFTRLTQSGYLQIAYLCRSDIDPAGPIVIGFRFEPILRLSR